MDPKGKIVYNPTIHRSHLTTCPESSTKKCNAYFTWVKYTDGWRHMYIPCEYCQTDWHKEIIDQLHNDLGEGWLEG